MIREILNEPRALESDHPDRALALYDRLAKGNFRFNLDILAAAVVLPLAARFVFLAQREHKPMALLLFGALGYGIPFLMQSFRMGRLPLHVYVGGRTGAGLSNFLVFLLSGFGVLILAAVGAAFLGVMIELALGLERYGPLSQSRVQQITILFAEFLIVLMLVLACLPGPLSRRILASPEGLQIVAYRIAGCAVFCVLIWAWNRGLSLDTEPFLMGAGLLVGLVTSRLEIDKDLGRDIRIGQVRCLVRLGRVQEARFHLDRVTAPEEIAKDEAALRALIAP